MGVLNSSSLLRSNERNTLDFGNAQVIFIGELAQDRFGVILNSITLGEIFDLAPSPIDPGMTAARKRQARSH
jgi:hypothetical protein